MRKHAQPRLQRPRQALAVVEVEDERPERLQTRDCKAPRARCALGYIVPAGSGHIPNMASLAGDGHGIGKVSPADSRSVLSRPLRFRRLGRLGQLDGVAAQKLGDLLARHRHAHDALLVARCVQQHAHEASRSGLPEAQHVAAHGEPLRGALFHLR